MKQGIRYLSSFLFCLLIMGSVNVQYCFADKDDYRKELIDNKDFKEANDDYRLAIKFIGKADKTHTPQRAIKYYAQSEEYLNHALFNLKQIGQELSIDVSKEIIYCEDLIRNIHVNQGLARKDSSKITRGRHRKKFEE